ncbi:MAG: beta-ketoacyl-[acyl-carrier-protein] synthase family protein [Gammaproteobacteria bacterium]
MVNRVAVTGYGAVCALGNCVSELTESLRSARSGVRLIAADPASPPAAGGFPLLESAYAELSASDRALFDPVTRYAMHAAREALEQSGLLNEPLLRERAAVYVGTAMGGANAAEEAHRDVWYHGAPPKPLAVLCAMSNAPAAHLSIRYGLKGPNLTYSVACASSAIAIGEAFRAIREGRIECALVGGTEACITPVVVRAWQTMRILASVDSRAPGETCRPFSRNRSGLVLGEGAAMVVLERLHGAVARGAPVLCELLGFGSAADASHICIPSSEGQSAAIVAALNDACLAATEVSYISAHGTGTRVGDIAETRAIRQSFGDHASVLPISSTKSAHGHLLGAAGALEFVATLAALRGGFLPATLNLRDPDPECDLDYVPNEPRSVAGMGTFLSNSFAFGGSNAVLIAGEPR